MTIIIVITIGQLHGQQLLTWVTETILSGQIQPYFSYRFFYYLNLFSLFSHYLSFAWGKDPQSKTESLPETFFGQNMTATA